VLKFASSSQNIEKKIILSKKRGEITRFDGTVQYLPTWYRNRPDFGHLFRFTLFFHHQKIKFRTFLFKQKVSGWLVLGTQTIKMMILGSLVPFF